MTVPLSVSSQRASPATDTIFPALSLQIRPPTLTVLPFLSFNLTGASNSPLPLPRKKKISPGQDPETRSSWPSPSRSTNCGPNPIHQPVGTQPSGLPSLNLTPAANRGLVLVPTLR